MTKPKVFQNLSQQQQALLRAEQVYDFLTFCSDSDIEIPKDDLSTINRRLSRIQTLLGMADEDLEV